jgi:hypothetical protein
MSVITTGLLSDRWRQQFTHDYSRRPRKRIDAAISRRIRARERAEV